MQLFVFHRHPAENLHRLKVEDDSGSSQSAHSLDAQVPKQEASIVQQPTSFSVRGDGRVHKVGGGIASELRLGKDVLANATGFAPVNVTVKSLCISRQYVQGDPGFDVGFRVNHQVDANRERVSQLSFLVSAYPEVFAPDGPLEELRVSVQTRGRAVGAQIASIIQNKRIPVLRAVGPRSVGNMVLGATWARRFLRRKNTDVICYPSFKLIDIEEKAGQTSVEIFFESVPYVRNPYIDFIDDDDEDLQPLGRQDMMDDKY